MITSGGMESLGDVIVGKKKGRPLLGPLLNGESKKEMVQAWTKGALILGPFLIKLSIPILMS